LYSELSDDPFAKSIKRISRLSRFPLDFVESYVKVWRENDVPFQQKRHEALIAATFEKKKVKLTL